MEAIEKYLGKPTEWKSDGDENSESQKKLMDHVRDVNKNGASSCKELDDTVKALTPDKKKTK